MPTTGLSQTDLFYRLGVALVVGILIGLQREHAHAGEERELFAGVRTFGLLGLLGAASALLAGHLAAPWLLVVVIVAVGGLLVAAYLVTGRQGDVGLTSEVAALLTVVCGALSVWGQVIPAAAIGVVTTVLLSLKPELHTFARRLTRPDVYAALKLAVISVIVLPLLPDQPVAPPPFAVLNPFRIWLMVVFISGISFLGYVLFQLVGARRGIGLTGLLGGLVSSTAVTLSFAQRSRSEPALSRTYALGIAIAWTTMFGRVLLILAAVNTPLLAAAWPPLAAAAVVGLATAGVLVLRQRATTVTDVALTNPFELGPAIAFGLLYAGILLVAELAQLWLGTAGVYLASALAGITDVDAITLSMAELSGAAGVIDRSTAARAVALAALVNTAVKGGLVLAGGTPGLRLAMLPAVALMVVVGGSLALFL